MSADIGQIELTKAPRTEYEGTDHEDSNGGDISHEVPTPTRLQVKKFSQFLDVNITAQSIFGAANGFLLYFAMYGLRKPFKAATFEDENGDKIMWYVFFLSNLLIAYFISAHPIYDTSFILQVWHGHDFEDSIDPIPTNRIHEFEIYWYQSHK